MRWGRSISPAGSRIARTPALALVDLAVQAALIAALSYGLVWLVWIYGNGLRDPRYLDGWLLAGGMLLQLYIHVARKTARLSLRSTLRWRKLHIFLGYLLISAFISHSDYSMPDTGLEWALWTCFVLVALSGATGTCLSLSQRARRRIDEEVGYDRIPARRAELAQAAYNTVFAPDHQNAPSLPLPGLPHDDWIMDLYTSHLRDFFERQRHCAAHLLGSQLPLERMNSEIEALSSYVDERSREKLAVIAELVREKDRLDFTRVHLGLNRAWLLVHVPLTYALVCLTVLHVVVVYSYSSGAW